MRVVNTHHISVHFIAALHLFAAPLQQPQIPYDTLRSKQFEAGVMTGLSPPQSQHGSSSTSTRTINGLPSGHTAASNGSTLPLTNTAASNASPRVAQQPESSTRSTAIRKGGIKKAPDPSETSKLLAAKISQLELDQAGEKDQEAEIGT